MPAICKSLCFANRLLLGAIVFGWGASPLWAQLRSDRAPESVAVGDSTRDARDKAVRGIPFTQLTPQATSKLSSVIEGSSYFRRMPTQTLHCEPEVLISLARNPEVLVSIWDTMGITQVKLDRTAQYQHSGSDGAGTTCKLDLIYGNDSTHVYFVEGDYDGPMWPKKLTGRSVIILHQTPAQEVNGMRRITVWMDVFLKVDNIGADLVVRTLSPLVNKSADSNFVESVAFVEQISQAATVNSSGLQTLISKLNVSQTTKEQFQQAVRVASARATKAAQNPPPKSSPKISQNGYSMTAAAGEPNVSPPPVTVGDTSGAGGAGGLTLGAVPNTSTSAGTNTGSKNDSELISTRKGQASGVPQKAVSTDSPTIRLLNADKP